LAEDISAGFVRQRRNLIVISLVLLFAQLADLAVSELDVFGTKIKIGSPVAVDFALWLAWSYWLVRYYVYLHDLPIEDLQRHQFTFLQRKLNRDIDKLLFNRLRETHKLDCSKSEFRPSLRTRHVGPFEAGWRIRLTGVDAQCVRKRGNSSSTQVGDYEIFITGRELVGYERRAKVEAYLKTRWFTEYILPFVIAGLPFLYGLILLVC
jgi:hypothetical protein